jgi:polyhydroxybutyrate depolymerase
MLKTIITSILISICFLVNAQVFVDSIKIDGNYRSFHFQKPETDAKNYSLVFVLHGSGGSGTQMINRVKSLDPISSKEKFIAVYPNGYKNYWNECRMKATSAANQENINEEDFFKGMIQYFKNQYKINDKNVFAVGTSGGGHMAYKLALTIPASFRAITAIVANLPDTNNLDCPQMLKPMNVMIVNGTEDKTNPYNGGEVILGTGNFGFVRSSERTLQYWSALAGYVGEPVKTMLPDNDPNDKKIIEKYAFEDKAKKVILLKVVGGKHDYPNDIDVHLYAWEFFKSTIK